LKRNQTQTVQIIEQWTLSVQSWTDLTVWFRSNT
jgi:hypothetical protein